MCDVLCVNHIEYTLMVEKGAIEIIIIIVYATAEYFFKILWLSYNVQYELFAKCMQKWKDNVCFFFSQYLYLLIDYTHLYVCKYGGIKNVVFAMYFQ